MPEKKPLHLNIDGQSWLNPEVAERLDYVGAIESVFAIAPQAHAKQWDIAKTHAFLAALVRRSYQQAYNQPEQIDQVLTWCCVPTDPIKKLKRLLSECSDQAVIVAYQKIWGWFQGLESLQPSKVTPAQSGLQSCPQF
mgnify:CR=1 FL=1